jgi:hypothetical protein
MIECPENRGLYRRTVELCGNPTDPEGCKLVTGSVTPVAGLPHTIMCRSTSASSAEGGPRATPTPP